MVGFEEPVARLEGLTHAYAGGRPFGPLRPAAGDPNFHIFYRAPVLILISANAHNSCVFPANWGT